MGPSSLNAQIFPLREPRGALRAAPATRGALRARACYEQQDTDTGGQIPLVKPRTDRQRDKQLGWKTHSEQLGCCATHLRRHSAPWWHHTARPTTQRTLGTWHTDIKSVPCPTNITPSIQPRYERMNHSASNSSRIIANHPFLILKSPIKPARALKKRRCPLHPNLHRICSLGGIVKRETMCTAMPATARHASESSKKSCRGIVPRNRQKIGVILDEPARQTRQQPHAIALGPEKVPACVRQVSPLSFDDSEARFLAVLPARTQKSHCTLQPALEQRRALHPTCASDPPSLR